MIKKSYFIKTYNLIQILGTVFISSITFLLLIKAMQGYVKNDSNSLPLFQLLPILFEKIVALLHLMSIAILLLLLMLLLPEVINRLKNDSLLNLGKSYLGTLRFRRFLKQSQQLPKTNNQLDEQFQTENKSVTRFNLAVRKSVLDLTQDQLTLFIKVPKEAQAQKILKEHEEQIKEHVASFYSDYIISTFERKKFTLWLIGTKRN
ncbi:MULTISPECIES: hypothetical protein [Enterococcus]|uniref:hypothetical protein n=1 Tax=Enterococcus TaxID=1350 RepID=UPI000EB3100C|nr:MULTISPECIES: hypothetical protein [Enterococcus]AYJ44394.1 hypothetical protein D8N35_04480 [Enterococcus casseliflavus]MBS5814404.1 hypothetical protein [Enterococcus casseliflavus]MCD4962969.1 hypothetical protein [Enterococcus casseliflavus]MCD4997603.1 hypothetical protein [Enterococcus gallinarum]MDU3373903.1 hypothetical protein [Enterococcus casseliflavus]